MRFVSYSPPPPYSASIASVWYFEGTELQHTMERIVPNGAMQLLVNLRGNVLRWHDGHKQEDEQHLSGAALAGAFSRPIAIDTAQQQSITGVSFVPGGAAAFFRGSMQEFANSHVALSDLPGFQSVRDELLEARSKSARAVVRSWMRLLAQRWSPPRLGEVATARALLQAGVPVQRAADMMSVSVRKLRQDFSASVGLSPKSYARIHRLQQLVRSFAACQGERGWASLAVEHGYFDQAHMIHDFRSLAGTTPANYQPRSPEQWNHSVLY